MLSKIVEAVFKDGHSHLESNVASPHHLSCAYSLAFSLGFHTVHRLFIAVLLESKYDGYMEYIPMWSTPMTEKHSHLK